MGKIKILVIDDDLFWHRLLKRLFGETDYCIHAAVSCEEGIWMAGAHSPDCILLDFHLKDGNAVDVCGALERKGGRPKFPVIVVSSDPGAEIAAYAECRAERFVLKSPRCIMALPEIVAEVLRDPGRAKS